MRPKSKCEGIVFALFYMRIFACFDWTYIQKGSWELMFGLILQSKLDLAFSFC